MATAWAASSNDAITSTVKAFWTPAADANGEGLGAFTVVARDNGGAVRYGFRRDGDELGVYQVPGEDVICLWPKNMEAMADAPVDQAAHEA
jgi:hypothetical protein